MSVRKSILRTAAHHRELERRQREQHRPPVDWTVRLLFNWKAAGYHDCMCKACCAARGHKARRTIAHISKDLAHDTQFHSQPTDIQRTLTVHS